MLLEESKQPMHLARIELREVNAPRADDPPAGAGSSNDPPSSRPGNAHTLAESARPGHLAPVELTTIGVMRERARYDVALRLIWLLVGIIGAAFALAAIIIFEGFASSTSHAPEIDVLIRILEIVFGPVVALVAGAVGFYFATRDDVT